MRAIWDIMADPDINNKEELAMLQKLVDSGEIWHMEGFIGRIAADLLEYGYLKYPENRTYDFYHNPVPTRKEWEAYKKHQAELEKEKRLHTLTKPKLSVSLLQKPADVKEEAVIVPEVPTELQEEKTTEKQKKERLKA